MAQGQEEIATYHNERFGFRLSYPTARFKPKESLSEEGRMWVSDDGNARLLAGALPNAGAMSLKDYRAFVLKESYEVPTSTMRRFGTRGSFSPERATAQSSTSV